MIPTPIYAYERMAIYNIHVDYTDTCSVLYTQHISNFFFINFVDEKC